MDKYQRILILFSNIFRAHQKFLQEQCGTKLYQNEFFHFHFVHLLQMK